MAMKIGVQMLERFSNTIRNKLQALKKARQDAIGDSLLRRYLSEKGITSEYKRLVDLEKEQEIISRKLETIRNTITSKLGCYFSRLDTNDVMRYYKQWLLSNDEELLAIDREIDAIDERLLMMNCPEEIQAIITELNERLASARVSTREAA